MDYEHFMPVFNQLVRQFGKLRILFDMTKFHDWEAGTMWKDIRFGINHFVFIDRLAMIGDKKLQQGMAIFCKPFTKAAVRFFDRTGTAEARNWMAEA